MAFPVLTPKTGKICCDGLYQIILLYQYYDGLGVEMKHQPLLPQKKTINIEAGFSAGPPCISLATYLSVSVIRLFLYLYLFLLTYLLAISLIIHWAHG